MYTTHTCNTYIKYITIHVPHLTQKSFFVCEQNGLLTKMYIERNSGCSITVNTEKEKEKKCFIKALACSIYILNATA